MFELTRKPDAALIEAISEIIFLKGLKATTMDSVAAALSISKRTLYETFASKKDMILEVIKYWSNVHRKEAVRIIEESSNIMEALFRIFNYHLGFMKGVSVEFFKDMDREVRKEFSNHDDVWGGKMLDVMKLGIDQGVFRPDVNYQVQLSLMKIQMESLKRMEEFFPAEITIADAFDSICIGFLRSIASPKGMEILDEVYNQSKKKLKLQ